MKKIAFDIGGTYIKSAIIDENRQLQDYDKVRTPVNENDAIINYVEARLQRYIQEHQLQAVAVGISTAGAVDRKARTIAYANPNILNYTGTNFVDKLSAYVQELVVYNDVDAALLGELDEREVDYESAFCLTLGTGIGGSYYQRNVGLLTGIRHRPNQIGYLLYDPETKTQYEQRASTEALKQLLMRENYPHQNIQQLFEEAENGDTTVRHYIQQWAREVARGIAEIQIVYDPELIIIGGGVSAQGDVLLRYILPELKRYLPEDYGHAKVEVAQLQNHAALLGAVAEL
ncbi:ROK family protein [Staphylococcus pseudintermedius]|nr:ROK family protein [Staphylococcus pseudintermedius]EGQ3261693.1 ROK family protein [Staphylococcus pseudintermedius]EGQ3344216.1 ROK family protein [Staphylococcus pseudintermedius]EGQ3718916.1 ROK family protein [Staphylococcus pseudintermedius]EGQ4273288.1 ROK family protein [Staphylococcus pseudintermedius]